jgi:hypothetical protein
VSDPQFPDATVDGAAGQTGGDRHRADVAMAAGQCLIGREQPTTPLVEKLRRRSIAGSDLCDVNHTADLPASTAPRPDYP